MQGYIHGLAQGIDVKRLQIAMPIHKILVNIYKPQSLSGSLLQNKTSDIVYKEVADITDLEVIITNLEHYEKSDVIFESFEEDKNLMKFIAEYPSNSNIPSGSKVVLLDKDSKAYKTFLVAETPRITSVSGKVVAFQYELIPSYLIGREDNLMATAKQIHNELESGAKLEEDVSVKNENKIDIKTKQIDEEGVLQLEREGSMYYE